MAYKGVGAKIRLASSVSLLTVLLLSSSVGAWAAEDKAKQKSTVATAQPTKLEDPSKHLKGKAAPKGAETADQAAATAVTKAKAPTAKTATKTAKAAKPIVINRAALYPLLQKAYGQMLKGQFQEAVVTCLDAVRADRDSVTARRYLAYALVQMKAPDEALQQMIMVSRMIRPTAFDLYTFGEAYLQSGNYAQAEDSFKGALGLDPNFLLAKGGLIKVMSAKGQYDDAFRACIDGLKSSQDQTSQGFYRLLYAGVQESKMNPPKTPIAGGDTTPIMPEENKADQGNNASEEVVGTKAPAADPGAAARMRNTPVQDNSSSWDAFRQPKVHVQRRADAVPAAQVKPKAK